jgi:hypothetical protein
MILMVLATVLDSPNMTAKTPDPIGRRHADRRRVKAISECRVGPQATPG